jgi:hypothetical protein
VGAGREMTKEPWFGRSHRRGSENGEQLLLLLVGLLVLLLVLLALQLFDVLLLRLELQLLNQ